MYYIKSQILNEGYMYIKRKMKEKINMLSYM